MLEIFGLVLTASIAWHLGNVLVFDTVWGIKSLVRNFPYKIQFIKEKKDA